MNIILEQANVPKTGVFRIHVDRIADVRISAEDARKSVRRWLQTHVTMMMSAELPTLTLTRQIVWRVPIVFTSPHQGKIGEIGTVDVEVQTGHIIDTTEQKKSELLTAAKKLSKALPAYQPRQSFPMHLTPHHLPRSPILELPTE